jgi:hypothetical protein
MSRNRGASLELTIWCDNCGVEITWAPLIQHERDYCCLDCFEGRPCRCAERMEVEDDRRTAGNSGVPAGAYPG